MSVARLAEPLPSVTVEDNVVVFHDLTICHPESAAFLLAQQAQNGPDVMVDLVRRALPVGIVALSAGAAGMDTGRLTRTLDSFSDRIDAKSSAAIASLGQTVERLHAGEDMVIQTARSVLEAFPAQVEAALAGQAGTVRASVTEATRAAQAAALQELNAALDRHAASVQAAVSLDREGPVRTLRQDVLLEVNNVRRELSDQLSGVRALIEATQAVAAAGVKTSRARGDSFEADAMALCHDIATAAGDMFERTGDQPGVGGTTRRVGDGVATLSPAISGPGRKIRIVVEAKVRSRPLSAKAHAEEIANGCRVRDAAGGLVVVPTDEQVPGNGPFARVDGCSYVVSAADPRTVALLYLLLREHVAILSLRQGDESDVDLVKLEAKLKLALEQIAELDEVGRLGNAAKKQLEKLLIIGQQTQQKIRDNLTEGLTLLHS